jgi:hypothetical protein
MRCSHVLLFILRLDRHFGCHSRDHSHRMDNLRSTVTSRIGIGRNIMSTSTTTSTLNPNKLYLYVYLYVYPQLCPRFYSQPQSITSSIGNPIYR